MTRRSKSRQQELRLATWGGRREGAGRKPKGKRPGVPHAKRETIPRHCPARVTLRVLPDVWNLRHARMMAAIRSVFWRLRGVGGMRLTQFSIQSNHMHLIVEADGNDALSRGMRTLCARIAAELNRVMCRTGHVFADRYHLHVLRTPREVQHAIRYVRENGRIHAEREGRPWPHGIDPCTGGPCPRRFPPESRWRVVEPRTWLLRRAWKLPPLPAVAASTPVPLTFPWMHDAPHPSLVTNLDLALEAA